MLSHLLYRAFLCPCRIKMFGRSVASYRSSPLPMFSGKPLSLTFRSAALAIVMFPGHCLTDDQTIGKKDEDIIWNRLLNFWFDKRAAIEFLKRKGGILTGLYDDGDDQTGGIVLIYHLSLKNKRILTILTWDIFFSLQHQYRKPQGAYIRTEQSTLSNILSTPPLVTDSLMCPCRKRLIVHSSLCMHVT